MNRLHCFEAFGIELEYMLVDRDSLDVRPVADRVLEAVHGSPTSDFETGVCTWSNELALHVIELKGTLPTAELAAFAEHLHTAVRELEPALAANNVQLLPTGMHPWMRPETETVLWPHENAEIYQAYHRLFDCFRHGWANVQSVHLNLPFFDDQEFAGLHAATRLVLPLLPALTASSPVLAGQSEDWRDMRMKMVRGHCDQVPFLTGDMIPEPIYDESSYRREIFGKLKAVIQPHDPGGVFDPNFLNARGAIARFDRGSVEIRVMDVQECPKSDIAVCVATIAAIKTLVAQAHSSLASQQDFPTKRLSRILDDVSASAEQAQIEDAEFLALFGVHAGPVTAVDLWRHILKTGAAAEPMLASFSETLELILRHGTLATRILRAIGSKPSHDRLREVYMKLGACLQQNKLLLPDES